MASQLYFQSKELQYRLVAKDGLGALIFREPCGTPTLVEHEHPEAQISMLFGGRTPTLKSHDTSGRTTRSRILDRTFLFVPHGQPHRLNWQGQGALVNLYLAPEILLQLSDAIGCAVPYSKVSNKSDRGIYEIGRFLLDEFYSTGALSMATVDHASALVASRVLRVTGQLDKLLPTGILSRRRIQPAVDYISETPERDFNLISLARLCHASVFHFARSFTAHIGAAPFAFQRAKRMEMARRLLRDTELSVGSVASSVGMPDANHFARSFRREVGNTPREFRMLQNSSVRGKTRHS